MAIDLKQEVSLSSIKNVFKRGGKGDVQSAGSVPTKVTMNLYQGDSKKIDVRKVVVVGVLLLIFIGLFLKFGVLDQLDALSRRQSELSQQQALLAQYKEQMPEYEQIREVYDVLRAQYGGDSPDAMSLITMVEQQVMPRATVSSIVYADNSLTLTLYNVPLDTVGEISKALQDHPSVTNVNVSNATTQNAEGQNTISTIVVTLAGTESKKG